MMSQGITGSHPIPRHVVGHFAHGGALAGRARRRYSLAHDDWRGLQRLRDLGAQSAGGRNAAWAGAG